MVKWLIVVEACKWSIG